MKKSSIPPVLFTALLLLASLSLVGSVFAQDAQQSNARAMYVVMPPHLRTDVAPPPASLQSWNGSFTYGSTKYTYNMVGAAPSTNSTATITTYIIPMKIVITARNGTKTTYDPSHVLSNGNTVTTNTLTSPLFDSTTTYVQGGVNVGTTQYIDAYQRGQLLGHGADRHELTPAVESNGSGGADVESVANLRKNGFGIWLHRGAGRYQLVRFAGS